MLALCVVLANLIFYLLWLIVRNINTENAIGALFVGRYTETFDFMFIYVFPFITATLFGAGTIGIVSCVAIVLLFVWAFIFIYSRGVVSKIAFLLTFLILCLFNYFSVGYLFDRLVIEQGFSAS